MSTLSIIVITLFTALCINILLKRIHLPTIIGYIVTGAIVTYVLGLQDAAHNHTLLGIAELGIAFLMFTIGLEFSPNKLKSLKYQVFGIGNAQIIGTSILVFALCNLVFGLDVSTSFIIALIVSLSSTAIVLKTLEKNKEITKKYGRLSLSILLMQDLFVIPVLLIINLLASSDSSIARALLDISISALILLGVLYISSKYLLEPFFNQIVKTTDEELFVGTILFLAIGASYLSYLLGFSYSLGAFVAGMLIAETKYKHQAEADLIPFRDILLGVFFITIGMQIDFGIISSEFLIILGILVAVLALKFVVIFSIIRFGYNARISVKTALSLMQIGEFSLAALELSFSQGLLDNYISQIILAVIILSMVLTPLVLNHIDSIANILTRSNLESVATSSYALKNHIVIIGFGSFGRRLSRSFKNTNTEYIAIENDIDIYHKNKEAGEQIIFGDATQTHLINQAKLDEARYVIVAINSPSRLYNICNNILKAVAKEKVIVKLHSREELELIKDLELEHIIIENDLTYQETLAILK